MNRNQILVFAAALALTGSVAAVDGKTGATGILSNRSGSVSIATLPDRVAPNGGPVTVCFSVNGIQSIDALDDPDNTIVDINIGAGNEVSGLAWDVNVATVGLSWLSEAVMQFSDSTGSADPNAINLSVGNGDDASGVMDYSSGGVLPFSSLPLPNIVAGPDGIFRIQFFDSFDDNAGTADADYADLAAATVCPGLFLQCTNQAACDAAIAPPAPTLLPPMVIPTLSNTARWLLGLGVLALGFVLVRQRG